MSDEVIFEPMPGKIAVRVEERTEIVRRGIISLSDPKNSKIGEVIAIYEPFLLEANDTQETEAYVKVGDFVVFGHHSGVLVEVDGAKCIILKETEILTKVRLRNKTDALATVVNPPSFDDEY